MKLVHVASVATFVGFTLACGAPAPVHEVHQGTLDASDSTHPRDGSYYEEYTFKVGEGQKITVTMESTEVDPYLQLRRVGVPDDEFLEEHDDIDGNNRNAKIEIMAPASGTYQVWANTYASGSTGAYTLRIDTEDTAK